MNKYEVTLNDGSKEKIYAANEEAAIAKAEQKFKELEVEKVELKLGLEYVPIR